MSSLLNLQITVSEPTQNLADELRLNGGTNDANRDISRIGEWLVGRAGGFQGQGTTVAVRVGAVQASGTITFSSIANNDTVTINGVVFTAKTSGATGNQFNIGSNDTDAATNLAAVLNASAAAKIVNVITATSALAVVTVTAVNAGLAGNVLSLAISAHGTVSAAALAGGTDGTSYTLAKG